MRNIDLFSLVAMAYGLQLHQLSAPAWLSSTRVDISARVPQGINADQYRRLLQSMLAERYHLATHRESREMRVFELTVGKDGPKLKKSLNQSAAADGLQPPPGRPSPPPGYHGPVAINKAALSMPGLAAFLSGFMDAPIEDATGLEGDYQVLLTALVGATPFEPTADNKFQSLFDALPAQLGLRLVPRKAQVDILVVDRMDKSPTEN